MRYNAIHLGLLVALLVVLAITAVTAWGPTPKYRTPVCPAGTAYVSIASMCIAGASEPVRWEWK